MFLKIYKISMIFTIACLIASFVSAKVEIDTEIVTGKIKNIENHVIVLDNNIIYYPVNELLRVDLGAGEFIALKALKDNSGKMIYIDFKAGKDSIKMKNAIYKRKKTLD